MTKEQDILITEFLKDLTMESGKRADRDGIPLKVRKENAEIAQKEKLNNQTARLLDILD